MYCRLAIDINRLTSLPYGLLSLPNLQVLSASENAIELPADIPITSPLGEIDFGTNRLNSSVLEALLRCTTLTALDISFVVYSYHVFF